MCGILGLVNYSKHGYIENLTDFKNCLHLMDHRGPDASGIKYNKKYIFGHTRLKIIDKSDEANQPFVSNDGKVILVFNGEIYNYRDLKKDLKKKHINFRTSSDTEVILNSYLANGINCIKDFNGMFSFAIFDTRIDKLFIVRDRLGIKPIFYKLDKNELIFASEIKSIISLKRQKVKLNIDAVSSYMSFRYPILDDSFIEGINSLPPGNYIEFNETSFAIKEYWNLSKKINQQNIDKGEEFYIKKITQLLKSSVRYRMISDVPIGSFLSGGVDSSVITAIMSNLNKNKKVKTFTIGFKEEAFNELKYAKSVSKLFNTDHKEVIVSSDNYISTLEKLIKIKDAPLSVPNEVPLHLMSKELKKDITVILSGEGADEIFGGYGKIFRSPYDLERINKIDNLNLTDLEKNKFCTNFLKKYTKKIFSSELDHFLEIYSYTSFKDKKKLLNNKINLDTIEKKFYNKILSYFNEIKIDSYYIKIMYVFEKLHLVGLLGRLDNASMSASVEARVPFVDHRLVEFAFTIPVKYKIKWENNKKREESKLLMSEKISETYDIPKYILKKTYEKTLPKDIIYRKKMGFPVPLNNWFGGEFLQYAKKILLSKEAKARNLYDITEIKKQITKNKLINDPKKAINIWMLINIELFCKNYLDHFNQSKF